MKYNHIIFAIAILLASCFTESKPVEKVAVKVPVKNEINNNEDCIIPADSVAINIFIKNLIKEMREKNFEKMALRMNDKLDFTTYISEDIEELESIFSPYNYLEESDSLVPILFEDIKINHVKKEKSDCYYIQVGFPTGLYMDVYKTNGHLMINRFDVAG